MPQRAKRVCQRPGCGRLCDGRYCTDHLDQVDQASKLFDAARGSSASRGYGRRWRRLSAYIIARDPLCQIAKLCTADYPGQLPAPSQCADHVRPRNQGGTDEESNLEGACFRCHNWKTRTQDSALAERDAARARGERKGQGGSNL